MKKLYEKPLVAIEHFELTQTIASCSTKIGFTNSTCVMRDVDAPAGMKNLAAQGYFLVNDCGKSPSMDSMYDGICYHTSVNAMFNS